MKYVSVQDLGGVSIRSPKMRFIGMRLLVRMVTLLACVLMSLHTVGAVEAEGGCWRDPASSLAVPVGGTGACVQEIGGDRLLVQYTRQGLLLAQVAESQPTASGISLDLQYTGGVPLIYCSGDLLDPVTGAPSGECLFAPAVPGPGAFTGTGQIQAQATVDSAGSLSCPSSIHILGLVTTPGGEAFQVRSSLLRFGDTAVGTCETMEESLLVGHLGSQSSFSTAEFEASSTLDSGAPAADSPSPSQGGQLALLEKISNLNDTDFELLVRLAKLQSADRQALVRSVDTTGRIHITATGTVESPGGDTPAQGPVMFALGDEISDVWDLLTNIDTRRGNNRTIAQVLTEVDVDLLRLLDNRAPAVDPELLIHTQTIAAVIADMDGATVAEFAQLLGNTFGDSLPFLAQLRAGFLAFSGSDCSAGSPCDDFKSDLETFLTDSRGNRDALLNNLQDLLDPAFPTDLIQLDAAPLQNILGVAPPFALFLMHEALEDLVPDWREIPATVSDLIPLPPPDILPGSSPAIAASAGNNQRRGSSALRLNQTLQTSPPGLADTLCIRMLSDPELRTDLGKLILVAKILDGLFNYINDALCPLDFTLGLSGTAVAGAGGGGGGQGTPTASPCRTGFKTVAKGFEILGQIATSIRDSFDRCRTLDVQAVAWESNLAHCNRIVSFHLPRNKTVVDSNGEQHVAAVAGYLSDLIKLVELRAWQMEQAEVLVVFDPDSPLEAAKRDLESGHYYTAYGFLCQAYEDLQDSLRRDLKKTK